MLLPTADLLILSHTCISHLSWSYFVAIIFLFPNASMHLLLLSNCVVSTTMLVAFVLSPFRLSFTLSVFLSYVVRQRYQLPLSILIDALNLVQSASEQKQWETRSSKTLWKPLDPPCPQKLRRSQRNHQIRVHRRLLLLRRKKATVRQFVAAARKRSRSRNSFNWIFKINLCDWTS